MTNKNDKFENIDNAEDPGYFQPSSNIKDIHHKPAFFSKYHILFILFLVFFFIFLIFPFFS